MNDNNACKAFKLKFKPLKFIKKFTVRARSQKRARFFQNTDGPNSYKPLNGPVRDTTLFRTTTQIRAPINHSWVTNFIT